MKIKKNTPPALAAWILSRITRGEERLSIRSDFSEIYEELASEEGYFKARKWYWTQVLRSIPMFISNNFYWRLHMLQNYLKVALRNLKKHKVNSFINAFSLVIGLTCAILIWLYIQYELSYDRYHKNAEGIYRIEARPTRGPSWRGSNWYNGAPGPLKPLLVEYPEIASVARICTWGSFIEYRGFISYKNKHYAEDNYLIVEPEFLDVFTFPLIKGDKKSALKEPFSILLTQKMAEKYFGDEDPMGKTILFDNKYSYKITGILKNVPDNSHFSYDLLVSFSTLHAFPQGTKVGMIDQWGTFNYKIYLLLKRGYDPKQLESKLTATANKYQDEEDKHVYRLNPLTNIHLHSNINNEFKKNGDIKLVYFFSAIATVIILIACFNFMNLSLARSVNRSEEVGLRKVIGAGRKQIIMQFVGESILFTLIALFLSIALVKFFLPHFSSLLDRDLSFNLLYKWNNVLSLVCATVLLGIVSGSYPAFFLASFKPINTIKGTLNLGKSKYSYVRNFLIISQFAICIILIICTIFVHSQLNYINCRNLGFEKDHIVALSLYDPDLKKNYGALKDELSRYPQILDTTVSSCLPYSIRHGGSAEWEGKTKDQDLTFYRALVDHNFLNFYGLKILAGRDFSKEITSDSKKAYILNKTAAEAIGWEDPVGKRFSQWSDGVIIGVIDDFHITKLDTTIEPLTLQIIKSNQDDYYGANYLSIKINSIGLPETLAFIEKKYKEFSPKYPFSFSFLDENVNQMYRSELKLGQNFIYFTVIAILIACLGLFGLLYFAAKQKTKEIGIRKVLGASAFKIFIMLSKESAFCVLMANLISWPMAFYIMNKWLQTYAYRIDMSVWPFVLSSGLALVFAFLTIFYQCIKAATANTVDSLRYE